MPRKPIAKRPVGRPRLNPAPVTNGEAAPPPAPRNGSSAPSAAARYSKLLLVAEPMLESLTALIEPYTEIATEDLEAIPETGFSVIDGEVMSAHLAGCILSARAIVAEAQA